MTGVALPFGKGRDLFEALTLNSLSDQTMAKATQAYGATAMEREQSWQALAQDPDKLHRRQQEHRKPLQLYGAIDATKVHIRGEDDNPWRDPKVGACLKQEARPPSHRTVSGASRPKTYCITPISVRLLCSVLSCGLQVSTIMPNWPES
jgi:hypothetical protein